MLKVSSPHISRGVLLCNGVSAKAPRQLATLGTCSNTEFFLINHDIFTIESQLRPALSYPSTRTYDQQSPDTTSAITRLLLRLPFAPLLG